ncbi:DUF3987 domain-containing protein [Prosthecobacter sp.]|uniref:DUF3987 domain-containing protein n=1 Tax=Prosthecobacter sp. TaxID=1965333 RepID=UPI002488D65D|nr:DUF3987 domain-containing protein [Prosthecobacter sp.]MDI1311218.1 DUF3987 domain-containing protein [Prosthecobacter sp.]
MNSNDTNHSGGDFFHTNDLRAPGDHPFGGPPAQPSCAVSAANLTNSTPGYSQATSHDDENSTNSTPGHSREHPIPEDSIPEDSILADYRNFVRGVSELPDALIIAPILALCGKLLTPHVTLDFGSQKPLTMYNFIATPAGLRKSTTFAPADKIARKILMSDDLIAGNASDSALFDTFENQPHRLQFEDEGNTILRSWETSAYGREVSARYLRLYDGSPWNQNFRRECKSSEDGKAERSIPQATLSLCIGSTFGVARLSQLEAGSGLRRRFGFYVATKQARDIWWPESLENAELDRLADLFQNLTHLKGSVGKASLTRDAMQYWIMLQTRNRQRCMSIPGYTNGDESLLSSLNESPMRCLKLAVIFQACRWAKDDSLKPFIISDDMLAMAEAHQDSCLDAMMYVEGVGRRCLVSDTAEWLMVQISGDHPTNPGQSRASYTKTELSRRFAANPGRPGALTISRLYGEIIPHLIEQGRCKLLSKKGKLVTYEFTWE